MTPSTGTALPEWPEEASHPYSVYDFDLAWQISHYWESRCRLAVKALEWISGDHARYTLKAIGPLPPPKDGAT